MPLANTASPRLKEIRVATDGAPDRHATGSEFHPPEPSDQETKAPGVLSGIQVIDMSRVVAGPLAGQILADLGADVIKIERRGDGDDVRALGPPWIKDAAGEDTEHSTYFQSVNRGKRSLTLDFTRPEGASVLHRLIAGADVVLENFRPGTLAKYSLGPEELLTRHPRLIYCSISGFGHSGPYAERSGYDYLVQAMGGQMAVTGLPDGAPGASPMRVGVPIADICAGNNAAIAILAALLYRERTGAGQHIDIALFDSQIAIVLNPLTAWLNGRSAVPRTGNEHPSAVPYGVFPTADGHLLIATFNNREFARLAGALGKAEWAEDPRFENSSDRVAHRAELVAEMSAVLAGAGRLEWMELLNAAKISCGPINTMADIEADPQVAAREMIVTLAHPVAGELRVAGSPLKMSALPVRYDRPPPLVGEHTDEILTGRLGLTTAEIAALRRAEVI